jgi:hypothetical protein
MKAAWNAGERLVFCPCRGSVMRNAQPFTKKSSNTPRPDDIVGKTSQVKTYGLDFTQRSRDWTQGFDKHIQGVSACGPQLVQELVAHVSVSHTPLWSLDPPVIIIAQTLSYVGR